MGAWSGWLRENWFTLVQTLGIVGSLWLTAFALWRDRRSQRVTDYLALASHHRDLWSETHRRPDLARIAQAEVDLLSEPITTAEREFLLLAIVHFHSGWLLARENGMITLEILTKDAQSFFGLPMPRAIWDETRKFRDPKFVQFVEDTFRPGRRRRLRGYSTKW